MTNSTTTRPLNIALMGTRGAPARYGGFETAVEEIGQRMAAEGHRVTVYCRRGNSGEARDPQTYLGMHLIHLPAIRHRVLETLSHSLLSVLHAIFFSRRYDAVVMCNAANAAVLPLLRLRRIPVAVHVDGLEWRRAKWGPTGQRYYRTAEALSVRWADALIADAAGIADYYREEFSADTELIAYGAPDLTDVGSELLAEHGLEPDGYHLVVARFEPENHVDLIVAGYLASKATLPLIVVGSNPYPTDHSTHIESLAAQSTQVRLLGGIWDQDLLDQLYANARTYLHGHSVGGTNPSLLRALAGGTPTIAYDVSFNREAPVEAQFCSTVPEFAAAISKAEADGPASATQRRDHAADVKARYSWDDVSSKYAAMCRELRDGKSQRGRLSGRRAGLRDSVATD